MLYPLSYEGATQPVYTMEPSNLPRPSTTPVFIHIPQVKTGVFVLKPGALLRSESWSRAYLRERLHSFALQPLNEGEGAVNQLVVGGAYDSPSVRF